MQEVPKGYDVRRDRMPACIKKPNLKHRHEQLLAWTTSDTDPAAPMSTAPCQLHSGKLPCTTPSTAATITASLLQETKRSNRHHRSAHTNTHCLRVSCRHRTLPPQLLPCPASQLHTSCPSGSGTRWASCLPPPLRLGERALGILYGWRGSSMVSAAASVTCGKRAAGEARVPTGVCLTSGPKRSSRFTSPVPLSRGCGACSAAVV